MSKNSQAWEFFYSNLGDFRLEARQAAAAAAATAATAAASASLLRHHGPSLPSLSNKNFDEDHPHNFYYQNLVLMTIFNDFFEFFERHTVGKNEPYVTYIDNDTIFGPFTTEHI